MSRAFLEGLHEAVDEYISTWQDYQDPSLTAPSGAAGLGAWGGGGDQSLLPALLGGGHQPAATCVAH